MVTEPMEAISIDRIMPENHSYRILNSILDFERINRSVCAEISGKDKYGQLRLLKCMILQYYVIFEADKTN